MELFEQKVESEGMYYVWKGQRAERNQRPMWAFYSHCSKVAELKQNKDGLFDIRIRAAKKYFSSKDSTHANIYRHYEQLNNW